MVFGKLQLELSLFEGTTFGGLFPGWEDSPEMAGKLARFKKLKDLCLWNVVNEGRLEEIRGGGWALNGWRSWILSGWKAFEGCYSEASPNHW